MTDEDLRIKSTAEDVILTIPIYSGQSMKKYRCFQSIAGKSWCCENRETGNCSYGQTPMLAFIHQLGYERATETRERR